MMIITKKKMEEIKPISNAVSFKRSSSTTSFVRKIEKANKENTVEIVKRQNCLNVMVLFGVVCKKDFPNS